MYLDVVNEHFDQHLISLRIAVEISHVSAVQLNIGQCLLPPMVIDGLSEDIQMLGTRLPSRCQRQQELLPMLLQSVRGWSMHQCLQVSDCRIQVSKPV